MLILRVHENEGVVLAGSVVRCKRRNGGGIEVAVSAPDHIGITRTELLEDPEAAAAKPWLFQLQALVAMTTQPAHRLTGGCEPSGQTVEGGVQPECWTNVGRPSPDIDAIHEAYDMIGTELRIAGFAARFRIIDPCTGDPVDALPETAK